MDETLGDTPYRTIKEIATYYRVNPRTVSRWIADGLPTLNVGSLKRPDHRITLEDVERYLRRRAAVDDRETC